MSRATQELQSIPFRHLIGAPLTAVVQAQAQAAQTTIEFIERVGFTPDASDPTKLGKTRTVKFEYNKVSENGTLKDASLEVPVLSIVPIPFIRIESTEINFTAKITETETIDVKTSTAVGAETKAAYSSWLSPVRVEFRANFSYNHNTHNTSSFNKEYQMNVNVRAVQDDLPAGLAKVLQILETSITEKTTSPSN